jgi:hypothetical protein
MTTLPRSKIRKQQKKLLGRQLDPPEVALLLEIAKSETPVHAGRLGLAESLVRRGWLCRERSVVRLSAETQQLLAEAVHP